jgi:hypothetical protein
MDPIESQRRRKRARKRGSARDFYCPVIGEQVLIALRRRTGALRWQDAFVWCSQDQCQYSGSNVPPCPLHAGLLVPPPQPVPVHCARCELPIEADEQNIVIRADDRVQHSRCPFPLCTVCARAVSPDDATRHDGATLAHEECSTASRTISGGCSALPWTVVFDDRLVARARTDCRLLGELRLTTREVLVQAADVRARAQRVRRITATLLQRATCPA